MGVRVAAVLLCAAALGGCLGDKATEPSAKAAGADIGGSIRISDCAGWRAAGPAQRKQTVRDIRSFAGGSVGESNRDGATLSDAKAYELFQGACRQGFAKRFKLYKLYTRAAAFQKLGQSTR